MNGPGRPALPANVHQLRGNPSKKPLAALLDDVVRPIVAIPECPAHLDAEARAEWDRITPHLEALFLVSELDRAALAAYCTYWSEYVWAETRIAALNAPVRVELPPKREGGRKRSKHLRADATGERGRIWDTPSGYKQMSVLIQIRNRALEGMGKFLAEFGMSPASRSRVTQGTAGGQGNLPGMDAPQEGGWGQFKPTT